MCAFYNQNSSNEYNCRLNSLVIDEKISTNDFVTTNLQAETMITNTIDSIDIFTTDEFGNKIKLVPSNSSSIPINASFESIIVEKNNIDSIMALYPDKLIINNINNDNLEILADKIKIGDSIIDENSIATWNTEFDAKFYDNEFTIESKSHTGTLEFKLDDIKQNKVVVQDIKPNQELQFIKKSDTNLEIDNVITLDTQKDQIKMGFNNTDNYNCLSIGHNIDNVYPNSILIGNNNRSFNANEIRIGNNTHTHLILNGIQGNVLETPTNSLTIDQYNKIWICDRTKYNNNGITIDNFNFNKTIIDLWSSKLLNMNFDNNSAIYGVNNLNTYSNNIILGNNIRAMDNNSIYIGNNQSNLFLQGIPQTFTTDLANIKAIGIDINNRVATYDRNYFVDGYIGIRDQNNNNNFLTGEMIYALNQANIVSDYNYSELCIDDSGVFHKRPSRISKTGTSLTIGDSETNKVIIKGINDPNTTRVNQNPLFRFKPVMNSAGELEMGWRYVQDIRKTYKTSKGGWLDSSKCSFISEAGNFLLELDSAITIPANSVKQLNFICGKVNGLYLPNYSVTYQPNPSCSGYPFRVAVSKVNTGYYAGSLRYKFSIYFTNTFGSQLSYTGNLILHCSNEIYYGDDTYVDAFSTGETSLTF